MKTRIYLFIIQFVFSTLLHGQQNKQEVVLLGTMHTVPKIVKKSYKPMLKKALKYTPEAIFVESPMATDSLSWNYLKSGWSKNYQRFYRLSDSMQQNTTLDTNTFKTLLEKPIDQLSQKDIKFLINAFLYLRDNGNYEYYSYLFKYGMKGAKKPTRHEDGDLTYKLALRLGHQQVYNMDDQQTNGAYHRGWSQCVKEGQQNGNNVVLNKLNKQDYRKAKLPAIFRGLGKHTNQRKKLNRLHQQSSFSYVLNDTEGCKKGRKYWNQRNERMANNIAQQIKNLNHQKNLVIVGAAHIIGLEKALKERYPNLEVKLMYE